MRLDQRELACALKLMCRVIPARAKKPILDYALATTRSDAIEIVATDLEVLVRTEITVADATPDQRFLIPAHRVLAIAQSQQNGALELEIDRNRLILSAGDFKARFETPDATEYPEEPRPELKTIGSVDAGEFLKVLQVLKPFCDRDITRLRLTGINLRGIGENIRCSATDGRILATATVTVVDAQFRMPSFILPATAVEAMKAAFTGADDVITLASDGDWLACECGKVAVMARAIEGRYPNINDLARIPTEDVTVDVQFDADEFISATSLVRAAVCSPTRDVARFQIGRERVTVSMGENGAHAKAVVGVKPVAQQEGRTNTLRIAFAVSLIERCVAAVRALSGRTECRMVAIDANSPVFFPLDGGTILCMPCVIGEEAERDGGDEE
jgi:DNA polymerase III sliding clamp (beta) subunit (PCNA family)